MTHLAETFLASREVSAARRAAIAKLLADLAAALMPRGLEEATAADLDAFLQARLSDGLHPNTVGKYLLIARTFFAWMCDRGEITATTLLTIRDIRPPAGSSSAPQPRPYTRTELRELCAILDARWSRLFRARSTPCRRSAARGSLAA